MKFTDYSNLAKFQVGILGFAIHQAAGLSTRERAETFIKVRKGRNIVVLATYRASAAKKLLAVTKLTLLGKVHTVTSYKALDPANTRGVLHGVPLSYTLEEIRASLIIPGHRILDLRRMGDSYSILVTIKGPRLPREAVFRSAIFRLYPPHIYCKPCLHCLSLHHRTDVCPTRKDFVRCRDCGSKFPPNQDPADTPHNCKLHCFNCQGDHSATDPSCQVWKAATQVLRSRARTIRNRYRYGLAKTSLYVNTGALARKSASDRQMPLDGSRTRRRRRRRAAPNGIPGEDLLKEQACSLSQHRRDEFRHGRSQMISDRTHLGQQSPDNCLRVSTPSRQVTAETHVADSGPSARVQGELQSRLNKINEERDVVRDLLEKLMEKADAVAIHASSALENGPLVGAFIEGCTALDGMFMKLFHVYTLLSAGDNSHPEHHSVPHRVIAHPSPLSGAKLPPKGDAGSCLSGPPPGLNGPSGAPPSVTHEAPKP